MQVLVGNLVDEARPDAGSPFAVHKAGRRACYDANLFRPRDPDISQPTLLFEAAFKLLVQRSLRREAPILPSGQKHDREFQPFRSVKRHDRDFLHIRVLSALRNKGDVFKKGLDVLEFIDLACKLVQVVDASFGVGRLRVRPHFEESGLLENFVSCGRMILLVFTQQFGPFIDSSKQLAHAVSRRP